MTKRIKYYFLIGFAVSAVLNLDSIIPAAKNIFRHQYLSYGMCNIALDTVLAPFFFTIGWTALFFTLAVTADFCTGGFLKKRIRSKTSGKHPSFSLLLKVVDYCARIASGAIIILAVFMGGFAVTRYTGAPKGPNVILISIDTLRPDHLGCYGYERNTSPHIDRLAEDAILFTHAIAQSSFTPPSHASILTSRYVSSHSVKTWDKLNDKYLTIAEIMKNAGYATAAVVNLPLLSRIGLRQGFDKGRERTGSAFKVNDEIIGWLSQLRKKRGFFIFLHYYDIHRPYAPREIFEKMFDDNYEGTADGSVGFLRKIWKDKTEVNERDVYHIDALYDGGIRQFDEDFNHFLDYLESMGLYDDALIIITSDHGEMMGYHPDGYYKYTHDPSLYNGVIRLPLIIKFPGSKYAGRRLDDLVESIDIVPTILEYLGLYPNDKLPFQGKSLMPLIDRDYPGFWKPKEAFSETNGWEEKQSLMTPEYKLIYDKKENSYELYHLKNDPLELRNSYRNKTKLSRSLVATMKEKFMSLEIVNAEQAAEPQSEEFIEDLKSLGYL